MQKNNQKTLICSFDSAIDHQRASRPNDKGKVPLDEYITHRDMDTIRPYLIPAEKPTIFTVSTLSRKVTNSIAATSVSEFYQARLAFACGVIRVENHVADDGRLIAEWKPARVRDDNTVYMSDDEVDIYSPGQVLEIGSVIWQSSFLPRQCAVTLRLPRMLREYLDQITAR